MDKGRDARSQFVNLLNVRCYNKKCKSPVKCRRHKVILFNSDKECLPNLPN